MHDTYFTYDISRWHIGLQVNGLRQGSVVAPTLFNLYTNDLSVTSCLKFIYADDILLCLSRQIFYWAREHTLSRLTCNMPGWVLSTVARRMSPVSSILTMLVPPVNCQSQVMGSCSNMSTFQC